MQWKNIHKERERYFSLSRKVFKIAQDNEKVKKLFKGQGDLGQGRK